MCLLRSYSLFGSHLSHNQSKQTRYIVSHRFHVSMSCGSHMSCLSSTCPPISPVHFLDAAADAPPAPVLPPLLSKAPAATRSFVGVEHDGDRNFNRSPPPSPQQMVALQVLVWTCSRPSSSRARCAASPGSPT